MADGLVRSFGSQSRQHDRDEGSSLWREIDRVFDNLARSFGRDQGNGAHRGFAGHVLAPDQGLPEIPLAVSTPAPLETVRLHAEEAPKPSMQTSPAKSEVLSTPQQQPTPIRLNRAATPASSGPLSPVSDAAEDDDGFEITVELPGIRPDDIDIEFADGGVTIGAERKRATEASDEKKHHVRERSFGTFKRRFAIPFQANPDIIEASFEDGVVIVTVPRPPETKPRTKKIGLKKS